MPPSPRKKFSEKADPVREALRGAPKRAMMDVVRRTPSEVKPIRAVEPASKEEESEKEAAIQETEPEAVRTKEEVMAPHHEAASAAALPEFFSHPHEPLPQHHSVVSHTAHTPVRRRRRQTLFVGVLVAAVLLGSGALFVTSVLPRARVSFEFVKIPANFSEQVRVDSRATAVQVESGRIVLPGELLTARKNLELSFETTGTKQVETRAAGKLFIYNTYSSSPQVLVAGTRIESPEGKLFRLNQKVTIPAAKVENGKIVPSKIEVTVTADGAGEAWNVPAATGWHIPGLKGSPKYDGFYGESAAAMAGGFVGEQPMPSEAELIAAREKVRDALKSALESQLLVALSDDFKVLEGTAQFKMVKEETQTDSQNPKTFSIFGEAELRELVFAESMLRDAIKERASRAITYPTATQNFELTYGTPKVEENVLAMGFTAEGSLVFVPDFDPDQFRTSMLGKEGSFLTASVFALPGVTNQKVSLWPFWVHSVPTAPGKMEIVVE